MKKTIVPVRQVRLNDLGYHYLIQVKINGKKSVMLIDTGASNTVFDKTRIARFIKGEEFSSHSKLSTGLGTNSMETMVSVIDTLELGSLVIHGYPAMILDLHHVNTSYASMKLKPIDGVLGGDVLKKYKAVIDCGKKTISLFFEPSKKKVKKR
jgi:hypothetical protein